MADKYTARCY